MLEKVLVPLVASSPQVVVGVVVVVVVAVGVGVVVMIGVGVVVVVVVGVVVVVVVVGVVVVGVVVVVVGVWAPPQETTNSIIINNAKIRKGDNALVIFSASAS